MQLSDVHLKLVRQKAVTKMNLRFIIFGKAREDFLKLGYQEYVKRLSKYAKVTIETLPEENIKEITDSHIKKALDTEAKKALNQIKENDFLCLCDIHAKKYDTLSFSSKMKEISDRNGNIVFLFGSSYGLSDILRKRANFSFSLSNMTFTHYMALLITLEQVYRSMKINNNEIYDK